MDLIDAATFTADRAWGGRQLLAMGDHDARLLWTDQPYRWHENSGDEVLVVLDGVLDMHYDLGEGERVVAMHPGHIAVFRTGERHVGHPRGAVRLLVIERTDSD